MSFTLAAEQSALLQVYDAGGKLVRTLARRRRPAGPHRLAWDGRDDAGQLVASGLYFFQLATTEVQQTRKAIHLK